MSVSVASMAISLSIGEIDGIVRTVLHTSKTVFTPAGSLCPSINHSVIATRTNVRTDTTPYAGIGDGKLVTCFNGKCRSMLKIRYRATCVPDVTRHIIYLLSNLLLDVFEVTPKVGHKLLGCYLKDTLHNSRICSCLDLYKSITAKCYMLIIKNISELIACAKSVADTNIHIVMGMPIYPIVYAAVLNEICKFHDKRSVGFAVFESWAQHLE